MVGGQDGNDNSPYDDDVTADLAVPSTDIISAVAALPLPAEPNPDARWGLRASTVAWLRDLSAHSRRAYFRDLAGYLDWCRTTGLDPLHARRADIDTYVADRCAALQPASRARRLSTLSSWYQYLISNDVAGRNPVAAVKRPKVDKDASPTVGLTDVQVSAFMRTARNAVGATARRDAALLGMLAELGLRVGEALSLDVASLGHNQGHRTVRVQGKGGKPRELPIPPPLGRDLDTYLSERARACRRPVEELTGPLFVTGKGNRVQQPAVFRVVQRIAAAAGIPAAGDLSPHSLRHTMITVALNAGAPLRDVQDMAGHADPRTTRRYDRNRGSLDRSPAYLIAGLFAHEPEPGSDANG